MTRSISQAMELQEEVSEPIGLSESEEVAQDQANEQIETKVVTTDEEKEAFEIVQKIASTSTACQHEVGFKDVESYFGLHVGKPGWWFMRLYLTQKKKSIVARLPISNAASLVNGFEVQEVSTSLGGDASRVVISSVKDLDVLAPLILKCYEMEASKHPVSAKKSA